MRCFPSIFVVGDSHTSVFTLSSLFTVIHIGPATAHNLIKMNSTNGSYEKIQKIIPLLKKGDIFIPVFGEIDCRIHIYYQFKIKQEKIPWSELIDNTIHNYGEFLTTIQQLGIKICVCGIIPVGEENNRYNYPYYAERSVQSSIFQEFNSKLNSYCNLVGIQFLDIYSKVSDEEGFLLKDYSDDGVHLNGKILPEIENMLYSKYGEKLRLIKIINKYR